MTERCNTCGAELYAGQQFCRRCGASVREGSAGEAPTRMLGGRETGETHDPELTVQLGGGGAAAGTDPSMRPPQTAPQGPFARLNPTQPLAPAVARKERARWVLPFVLGMGLACVGAALLIFVQTSRQSATAKRPTEVKRVIVTPPRPEVPAMPPEAVEAMRQAAEGAARGWEDMSGLAPLDETGAETDGDETVIVKSYPLDKNTSFVVRSVRGDVTVNGWDKPTAEMRVRKQGGSAEERRATPVMFGRKGERVVLANPVGGGPIEVSLEIMLPRGLRQLEVSADEADVTVKGFDGAVVADVKAGGLEFEGVTGTTRGKLIKGDAKISYKGGKPSGTQEFSVVRGNVEVELAQKMDADVKAETMDGDVDADDALGLKVVKTAAGTHALGRLGDGSEPLYIKVVNGDIKLKK